MFAAGRARRASDMMHNRHGNVRPRAAPQFDRLTQMSMLRRSLVALFILALLVPPFALAEGWKLTGGRFPEGKSTILRLTNRQVAYLDLIHRCHRDNSKTPYLFRLTPAQSTILKGAAKRHATRFVVVDSYRGDRVIEFSANVAVRFGRATIEIPHALVVDDVAVREYEVAVMGWGDNPLADVDPTTVPPGKCP